MWRSRRNQWRDLGSLLIANTVTGAASLMRRQVVELALPFPEVPGLQLHDHWLALVALASGDLGYVEEPLGDYVQHGRAVLGQVHGESRSAERRAARAAYFYGFLSSEVLAQALLARCGDRIEADKRRALARFVASQRSASAFAGLLWRGLTQRRHNLGTELELARGIAWKALVGLRAARHHPGPRAFDASCPPATTETLGAARLARWRATL